MFRRVTINLWFLFGLSFLAACTATSVPATSVPTPAAQQATAQAPSQSASATATAAPSAAPETKLNPSTISVIVDSRRYTGYRALVETFTNPNTQDWQEGTLDFVTTSFRDGGFHVHINQPDHWFWYGQTLGRHENHVRVSSDLTFPVAEEEGWAALRCRFELTGDGRTPLSFYTFGVNTAGYAWIERYNGPQADPAYTTLAETDASNSWKPAGSTNNLQADCVGDRLIFTINGVAVLATSDTELTGGVTGLEHHSSTSTPLTVLWDNFTVIGLHTQ